MIAEKSEAAAVHGKTVCVAREKDPSPNAHPECRRAYQIMSFTTLLFNIRD